MSRVADDKEQEQEHEPPNLPRRKKRHSSLLDIFVSHEQVNRIRMEERVSLENACMLYGVITHLGYPEH